LLNKTASTPAFSAPVSYTTDGTPSGIALNFNNAGGVSEVITSNTTGNDATALRANGDGTFIVSNDLPTLQFFPQTIAYGDLNGDNLPDIVTAASSAFTGQPLTVTILLTNPNGTFKAPINSALAQRRSFWHHSIHFLGRFDQRRPIRHRRGRSRNQHVDSHCEYWERRLCRPALDHGRDEPDGDGVWRFQWRQEA